LTAGSTHGSVRAVPDNRTTGIGQELSVADDRFGVGYRS
jgi:hypothetical protein